MRVLRKTQRPLSNREKLRICLKFDFGCVAWQSTPQNLLIVNTLSTDFKKPSGKSKNHFEVTLSNSKAKFKK